MTKESQLSFSIRALLALGMLGLTLALMYFAADYLNAFLLAWLIVLVASPLLYALRGRGAPSWLAFLVTLIVILIAFVGFGLVLVVGFNQLVASIPEYVGQVDSLLNSFNESLISLGIDQEQVKAVFSSIAPSDLIQGAINFLSVFIGSFSNMILVILLVVFLLIEAFSAPQKLSEDIRAGNEYLQRFFHVSDTLRKYFQLTTVVALFTGVVDTIFFLIIGVDFAVLWGITAFLCSYIPTLGFWLAAIPPTIMALLEFGPVQALVVFLGVVLINGFAENVIKPKYMGEGIDLSPLMVVFSVILWAAVLGPMGAILGVPVSLLFKELILEADDQNRWIAKLMGAAKPETHEEVS
ncbi:MAG: AI-2E family transporter [Anaerolineales bacterium]|nr:AI-2E family transporter [Anaerolineales bacterium]